MNNMNDIATTQTQEWDMERPIKIEFDDTEGQVIIECGGAQMPHYKVTGDTLADAIAKLIQEITRDAIADEAAEWRNGSSKALTSQHIRSWMERNDYQGSESEARVVIADARSLNNT